MIRLDEHDCSLEAVNTWSELDESWIAWLDVRFEHNRWRLICPEQQLFGLNRDDAEGPELALVLKAIPQRGIILNVHSITPSQANELVRIVEASGKDRLDVGVVSHAQGWTRAVRKIKPNWLYGADSATWAKAKLFSTLKLEMAADLWPDFYIASSRPSDVNYYSHDIAEEIRRRKKIMILDLSSGEDFPHDANSISNGFLTKRPKMNP